MKKISDFIPNKVIEKKQHIDKLDDILSAGVEDNLRELMHVINYSENSITIECASSSIASILKFEREKYLELFKNYGMYNIQDLKIKIK